MQHALVWMQACKCVKEGVRTCMRVFGVHLQVSACPGACVCVCVHHSRCLMASNSQDRRQCNLHSAMGHAVRSTVCAYKVHTESEQALLVHRPQLQTLEPPAWAGWPPHRPAGAPGPSARSWRYSGFWHALGACMHVLACTGCGRRSGATAHPGVHWVRACSSWHALGACMHVLACTGCWRRSGATAGYLVLAAQVVGAPQASVHGALPVSTSPQFRLYRRSGSERN